jgi:hypothetical protein
MNTSTNQIPSIITAALVPDANRLNFLPRHFGTRYMMAVEQEIFTQMREICEDYSADISTSTT